MKRIFSTIIATSLFTATGFAQGFYFRAGLGYAFPQAGQSMYDTPTPYNGFPTGYNGTRNNTAATENYNIKSASFSAGFQGVLGLGYMLNEHVGIQLDGGIGLSNKNYTFNDENVPVNYTSAGAVPITIPTNISTAQHAKTPIILIPSLVLQTGSENTWNLYSRLGLALPLNSKITQDQVFANAPGTGAVTIDDYTWQLKSSFSIGFTAAAGVKYKVNDRVSIWGEISLLSMSLKAKEQDLKSWTETSPQGVQSYPVSSYPNSPTIKYTKSAIVDSSLSELPAYSLPFSNIGFNFGISTTFSNSSRHSGKHTSKDDDLIDRPKRSRFQ